MPVLAVPGIVHRLGSVGLIGFESQFGLWVAGVGALCCPVAYCRDLGPHLVGTCVVVLGRETILVPHDHRMPARP